VSEIVGRHCQPHGSYCRIIKIIIAMLFLHYKIIHMTEKELRKLEGTIRKKMEDIKSQRVSLKDSGIGGLMNSLKKVDEALYEKILPEYKKMVAEKNIFK
ncbi:MAG: hypothetical protein WA874_18610, partial [Chryseosolibacter sp.]